MKIKIKLLLISFLILNINIAFSQTKISGFITDSLSFEKLPFASIRLFNEKDSFLNASVTDISGFFKLETKRSDYKYLKINYLGYLERTIEIVKSRNQNLGEIKLSKNENFLAEIKIEAFVPNIKHFPNRAEVTFDSINRVNSKTIYDLLKFIPGALVMEDKNIIKLCGNDKILILVNGFEKSNEFLNTISPQDVEKVEIVKNSQEFTDDAVTILNIVIKEEVKHGLNIDLLVDAESTYKNNSSNASIEYGYENIKFYVNYQFSSSNFKTVINNKRKNTFNNKIFNYDNEESTYDKNKSLYNIINPGINIYFKHSMSLYLSADISLNNNEIYNLSKQSYSFENEPLQIHEFYSFPKTIQKNYNYSVAFKKDFEKSTFSINTNYYNLRENENSLFTDSTIKNNISEFNFSRSQLMTYKRNSLTLKANYDYNFNDKLYLKTSYSVYETNAENVFKKENTDYLLKNNDFKNSLFTSLTGTLLGIDYNFGFKFQNYRHLINDSLIIKNYYFPVISFSKNINDKNYIEISTSFMPANIYYKDLMDVEVFTDSLTSQKGNKNIMQRTMNFTNLAYSYYGEKMNFSSSILWQYIKNSIYPIYTMNDNVLTNQKMNVNNYLWSSFDLTLTLIFREKLYFTQAHSIVFEGLYDTKYKKSGFNYNLYLTLDYYLSNFTVGTEFSYFTKGFMVQGYYTGSPYLKFYFSKNILNENGSLYLGIVTFNTKSTNLTEDSNFYNLTKITTFDQRIYLEFRYNLFKGKELKEDEIENIKDKN